MIQEVKELFGRLEAWQVTHIWRTANSVAHQLSKFALESRGDQLWLDHFPKCIHPIVLADFINNI